MTLRDRISRNEQKEKSLQSSLSKAQIVHSPRQITSKDQFREGVTYVSYLIVGDRKSISWKGAFKEINEDGRWIVMLEGNKEVDRSLADNGIIPYRNGSWNNANWIEPEQ